MKTKKRRDFFTLWRENRRLRDFVYIISLGLALLFFAAAFDFPRVLSESFDRINEYDFYVLLLILMFIIGALGVFAGRRWKELREEQSKRKNIENKMLSGRSQLQAVLDGVPDMILQVDINMRIRWANKAALSINPNAIGYKANQAFNYQEGSFLDSYCNWAMELKQIRKGITYQPYVIGSDYVSYWEGIGVPLTDKNGQVYGAIAIARDITKRMRLEHTWNLLSSIVESTDDAIFGVSWEGTILSWNAGAEEIYGYKQNEIVGRPITDLVPVESREQLLKIIERVSRKEQIERLETVRITKNGEELYISQTICPFVDATGKKIGVSLIDRDITESKRAERALIESETRFKELFEHMRSGVIVMEPDKNGNTFNIKNVNESVTRIENKSREEMIGMDITDIFPPARVEHLFEAVKDVHEGGEHTNLLITIREKDRIVSWREADIYKLPLGEIVAIYDDVTESKKAEEAVLKSEEKFRTLVTTAPDGIVLTDSDGKIIELNEAFASIFGYTREEMLGVNMPKFLPEAGHNGDRFVNVFVNGSGEYPKELIAKTKDGKEVPIELALESLKDQNGNTTNMIAVLRDITDRKKFEDELKNSREQLRQRAIHLESAREEERKRIAFEIHDELGYALTALKLDVSWLSDKMGSSQQPLIKRFDAMEDLIETTIKKVRTISTKLRPSILDHFGVVAAIEWQANEFQRRTGVRCIMNLKAKELKLNDNHATAIFRIFQETLTNVARHSKATRINVDLKAEDGNLSLRVVDNGIGISPDKLKSQKTYGLLGIRERANFMGGKVRIEAIDDGGTAVFLTVPLANLEEKDHDKVDYS